LDLQRFSVAEWSTSAGLFKFEDKFKIRIEKIALLTTEDKKSPPPPFAMIEAVGTKKRTSKTFYVGIGSEAGCVGIEASIDGFLIS